MNLSSNDISEGSTYLGHDSTKRTISRIENGHVWYSQECIPVWQFIVWAKEILIQGERKNGNEESASGRTLHDLQPRDSRSRQRGRDTRKNREVVGRKKKWRTDDF